MPTPMTRDTMDKLTSLQVRLSNVFFDQIRLDDPIASLFNIGTSTRAVERNLGVGGLADVPEYKGSIEYDNFETLYRADYTHREYAKGIAIERKLIDDDEYNVMNRRAELAGIAFDRTVLKAFASVFVNAFVATDPITGLATTGADGVSLCNTSHPYSPTDATVQGNKGTTALSDAAVISTKGLMRRYKDSRGNPINVVPDTLIVPTELESTAHIIVDSMLRSGTNNNDMNFNQGYNVITSNLLTDTNDWFMVDSRLAKMYLNWYWRVTPEFTEDPTSDYNLAMRYRGYMRYSYGWDSYVWIYGHNV